MNIEALNGKQLGALSVMAAQAAKYVFSHVPERDRWCQLAEEAAELAQAALKVVRAMDGSTNPAENLSYQKAKADVVEEMGDVENAYTECPVMHDVKTETAMLEAIANAKMVRWAERLGWTYQGDGDDKDTKAP